MPKVKFLPHKELCPEGLEVEVEPGVSLCNVALQSDIELEHACDQVCACTTCHLIVREGFDSLEEPEMEEEDMLDQAWGLEPESRLGCQALVGEDDLVIEIPKYTINLASEGH